MSIGIRVGNITDEIGSSDFLHAFFSTISVHCEPKGWGSRFPQLMGPLYQGHLSATQAKDALKELKEAKALLAKLPPYKVVWDIENRTSRPPWGDNISPEITNLSNYFVTSSGRDLFGVLEEALTEATERKTDAYIE